MFYAKYEAWSLRWNSTVTISHGHFAPLLIHIPSRLRSGILRQLGYYFHWPDRAVASQTVTPFSCCDMDGPEMIGNF